MTEVGTVVGHTEARTSFPVMKARWILVRCFPYYHDGTS